MRLANFAALRCQIEIVHRPPRLYEVGDKDAKEDRMLPEDEDGPSGGACNDGERTGSGDLRDHDVGY